MRGDTADLRSVRDEDRAVTHQVGDLPDEIATKINPMADQVAEDSRSGPVAPESPGQRSPRVRGVISQEPNIDGGDSPDAAVGDQLTSQLDCGRVPVVEPSRGLHACSVDGVGDLGRFACVAARRLLHPDVLSRFSGGDSNIAVDKVRASDADQIKVITLDQLIPVVVNRGKAEAATACVSRSSAALSATATRTGCRAESRYWWCNRAYARACALPIQPKPTMPTRNAPVMAGVEHKHGQSGRERT